MRNEFDQTYHGLLAHLLDLHDQNRLRQTRNDTASTSDFGLQVMYDMRDGTFPLLTTKRVHWKSIVVELLWFLRGDTNTGYLKDHGVTIWDEWADENGDLGPVYGSQWRSWKAPDGRVIDQIANVIEGLRTNPYGRRHIVSAWNPAEVDDMALPPCHCLFQFYVDNDGRLSLKLYQRSADVFLGVPFNIASYALLLHIIAAQVGREVGVFVHSFGDIHLYSTHVAAAREQLKRTPTAAPVLRFQPMVDFRDYKPSDFEIRNYKPHGVLRAPVHK